MKNGLLKRSAFISVLCIGVLASMIITANAAGNKAASIFTANENGQTYGAMTSESTELPDLILAEGIADNDSMKGMSGSNVIVGYVLKSDVYGGTGPLAKPQTPEETIVYMEQLKELAKEAIAKGEEYVYYIPLYDKDGVTVIGKSGVSIPNSIREELGVGLPGDEG